MADLEDELRRRVAGAREQETTRQNVQRRADEAAHDATERRRVRCQELGPLIEESFSAAAAASDGAIIYSGTAMGGVGITVYHLEWRAPAPARVLRAINHYLDGRFEWDWVVGGVEQRGATADPLEFDRTALEQLILQLADQARWPQRDTRGRSIRMLRL